MKKAWLKLAFGIMACFFLACYGTCIAQTEDTQAEPQEQMQEQQGEPAVEQPAEQPQEQTAEQPEEQTTEEPAEQPAGEPVEQATESQPMAAETAPQAAATGGELPAPLESEMTVASHWSRNPYPATVPAGARVHIVERGDCLWNLAKRYYNNPFLWPQIWEANNYIPNAHWIYPGDPIVIPAVAGVSEEQIAQETAPGEIPATPTEGGEPGQPGSMIPPPTERYYPIALDNDLYCSGFITRDIDNVKLKIFGSEENTQKVGLALFDVVYINQGESDGISPGDEFTILHKVRSVAHPITLAPLGEYVTQQGRLKVVATQERTSTAQITYSCDAALVGDQLVPFEPREVPLLDNLPPVDRFSVEGTGQKGYVVFTKDDLGTVGLGYEVQLDIGSQEGVGIGTRMILYRDQKEGYEGTGFEKEIPRRVLGEIVVFSVRDKSSTGRIIQMYDFARVGDRVEVR
jgi:hypothetical protein